MLRDDHRKEWFIHRLPSLSTLDVLFRPYLMFRQYRRSVDVLMIERVFSRVYSFSASCSAFQASHSLQAPW
jgi:hypothetical protein